MTILTKLSEILKSSTHLSEMEEAITYLVREVTSVLLSERLEALDKEMVQPYLSKGWAIDRIEERQLTFSFGTVIFKRRRLIKSGEKSFLPLECALSLPSRERFIFPFKEQFAYSTVQFVKMAIRHLGYKPKMIQTDNGVEFTHFKETKQAHPLDLLCQELGIEHKLIRPPTPRHNGKVEHSHRNNNRRFYQHLTFYSYDNLIRQMKR